MRTVLIVLAMITPGLLSAVDQPEYRYCGTWVPTGSIFEEK